MVGKQEFYIEPALERQFENPITPFLPPPFESFGSKLAIHRRYKERRFLCILYCYLHSIYGATGAFFHGGITGSNPVGDAKPFQELMGNGHFWRRHKKGTTPSPISGPVCLIASVFGHPELFL